ncbi:type IV toxin-antitoxin system AbiEi family antitoxin domain-containing protein [Tomitella cavernea]|uniref:AbiEi antitoxin N-terminal domain-containing protein n=1 Tax=Tomitella cavernea TaxID=1387982 RepID=A0ABP9BZM4_9ACTN|nr:type IV toxin-antitoxin system AbiEi family antitoxin domain-containing protein [Tomitella cavernea]
MIASFSALDLADLAAGQWGLFTTAQARSVGVSPQQLARLANRGIVDRIRHGTYRISGAPMERQEQIRGAWLMIESAVIADDRLNQKQPAVVSHRSAAQLHDLGDVDADIMEFIVARRKQSRLTDVRYRVATLPPERWTLIDGLPVTTALATIEDLAADHLDGGHLAGIVRDAVTTGRIPPDEATAVLRPYAHSYGAPLGDGSALLDRFLDEVGIPESTRQLSRRLPVNRNAALAAAHDAVAEAARQSPSLSAGSPLRRALAEVAKLQSQESFQQALEQAQILSSNTPVPDALQHLRSTDESGALRQALADFNAARDLPPDS